MNRLSERLEEIFIDITFAEEDGRTALTAVRKLTNTTDTLFMAISFAEAGEYAYAQVITAINPGDSHRPSPHGQADMPCFCMGRA